MYPLVTYYDISALVTYDDISGYLEESLNFYSQEIMKTFNTWI